MDVKNKIIELLYVWRYGITDKTDSDIIKSIHDMMLILFSFEPLIKCYNTRCTPRNKCINYELDNVTYSSRLIKKEFSSDRQSIEYIEIITINLTILAAKLALQNKNYDLLLQEIEYKLLLLQNINVNDQNLIEFMFYPYKSNSYFIVDQISNLQQALNNIRIYQNIKDKLYTNKIYFLLKRIFVNITNYEKIVIQSHVPNNLFSYYKICII